MFKSPHKNSKENLYLCNYSKIFGGACVYTRYSGVILLSVRSTRPQIAHMCVHIPSPVSAISDSVTMVCTILPRTDTKGVYNVATVIDPILRTRNFGIVKF